MAGDGGPFIRRENIKRYRQLLEQTTDEKKRAQILKLLAEEEQKQQDAGDRTNRGK